MFAAILIMAHAGNSTWKHFSKLKALGRSQESVRQVPLEPLIETLVALVVFILGITLYAPPLREITWASEMRKRTVEEMSSRPSFIGFSHLTGRTASISEQPTPTPPPIAG